MGEGEFVPPNEIDLKKKRKDYPPSPLSQFKIDNKNITLADPDKRIAEVEEQKRKKSLSSGIVRKMKINPISGEVVAPRETDQRFYVKEKYFILNPPDEIIETTCEEKKNNGGIIIVDVGHGKGISTDLDRNDVLVGIEPFLGTGEHKIISLSTGRCKVDRDSDTFVLEAMVEDVKIEIKPDLVMCIAPHPKDIMNGSIFVAVKEHFLDNSNAHFLLVIEGDSVEAKEDRGQMLASIKESFGEEYEVIALKRDTTIDSIPENIMQKHFGVERRVVFNSNSFQGEGKKTIYKIRKKLK